MIVNGRAYGGSGSDGVRAAGLISSLALPNNKVMPRGDGAWAVGH